MKKRIAIITVAAILIVGIAVTYLCFFYFRTKDVNKLLDDSLKKSISASYVPIKGEKTPAYIDTIKKLNSYEITGYKSEENIIIATVNIKAPDLYSLVKELEKTTSTYDKEEISTLVDSGLKEAPVIEKEIELCFETDGKKYCPLLTSDFLDAYYGGAVRLVEEYKATQTPEVK